ncbi:calcium-activated chloride channel-domain-containing protein [Roridomyces roridus]|uniref:Calcium-activated chloride channel-domain-containing protein n=1 Tax=Roridomyces roridus TaxID=1738132 RepID=A0AAD7CB34_9AGAR|nr:calcium-activated chloride channel-domain-containing protein [Roridomyces roridus]
MPLPEVDLVVAFRASRKASVRKQEALNDARKAEEQYSRLIKTLSDAGLKAVGRRGESLGHLLVFVSCPTAKVKALIKRERHSDFLSGLPTTPLKGEEDLQPLLSPADRIRLVHGFVTSMPSDGGLGISPDSPEYDLVESIMALHDREFNERWIHAWTTSRFVSVKQERLRENFGDAVAMYFSFLHSYSQALLFPAVLGVLFYLFGSPYSPIYSILILLWSVVYVEWWRIRERILSLRFGTRGSARVERRRAQYIEGFPWWRRELRQIASLPVLALFGAVLVSILTGIFAFEAFVTQLYTGPGHQFISFSPTVLFVALVPRLLAVYHSVAARFTAWENHAHQSSHAASLTLKTFALSALVAYMGLALSAFVYVPFGEGIMRAVQVLLFRGAVVGDITGDSKINGTVPTQSMWNLDTSVAGQKLNAGRLEDQMFAYTVTNQVVNTFVEVGLPYVLRGVEAIRAKRSNGNGKGKKRVVFEDEKEKGGAKEREFLEDVRRQVNLPEYDTFQDYSEMVTQFGYVALWSTIWPLAPAMALINNFFELRSDAFKITVHNRRPIPIRTDTIGPWLDALSFLTWLAALTNSALVYLFCPRAQNYCNSPSASPLDKVHQHIMSAAGVGTGPGAAEVDGGAATRELLGRALLIALAASHGYIALRAIVRHVMEKALWYASGEVREREQDERAVKARFLTDVVGSVALDVGVNGRSVEGEDVVVEKPAATDPVEGLDGFWDHDEGMQEISRITKDA